MFVDSKYLCSIARAPSKKTRFEIWHKDWENGNDIPRSLLLEHKLRTRPPPAHPGKKRARTAPARLDVSGDDEDGSAAQNARAGSSDERVVDN
ncbi:hypothetical protein PC116_g4378 [Phytophthora cactorum]|uniref:Uncharacterized protein n=1 Tax=Phytophthora cactorum TaxID=29920 RepID=A0A329S6F1_9STRA|nr:hypothetical protein PC112_g20222 [Phytophthora cactorum]KAG2815560.1 hypothetical protein PC111_g13517 [Phytophthora cactorum]KAG2850778.1 hypothetical protein PC113_g16482 [Phytophthora cactorum]KAG2919419.1 hypothetical protein PC117_g16780 [Phytophthora cactorum]KAG2986792.1 hypothetical protein PC118_g7634 [Phytophthora cactorum]